MRYERTKVSLSCARCGQVFRRYPSQVNATNYCSAECKRLAVPREVRACDFCGKTYERAQSQRGPYCSRVCTSRAQAIRLHAKALTNYTIDPAGCWVWQGVVTNSGYGSVRMGRRYHRPHRVIYEAHGNIIPEGFHLHHRCGNLLCCNPKHLEPISPSDHALIHWRARRLTNAN